MIKLIKKKKNQVLYNSIEIIKRKVSWPFSLILTICVNLVSGITLLGNIAIIFIKLTANSYYIV